MAKVCLYDIKLCYAKYAEEGMPGMAWRRLCLGKTCMTPTNSVGGSCECRPTFEQTS